MPDDANQDKKVASRKLAFLLLFLRWKIVIPVMVLLLLILSPLIYRQSLLSQVPDIGDPFPVTEVFKPISEEENAYIEFKKAIKLWKSVSSKEEENYWNQEQDGWDPTDHLINKYLQLNRPALKKWLQAMRKNDYQITPIEECWKPSGESSSRLMHRIASLSALKVDRLASSGKPVEALPWLKACFRSSRHISRHGNLLGRSSAAAIFAISSDSAENWMAHPKLGSEQLMELLECIQETRRLTAKLSTNFKVEYMSARKFYEKWSYHGNAEFEFENGSMDSSWQAWFFAEPEFSRRVNAHMYANHLAFADLPRRKRPPMLEGDIFDDSAVSAHSVGRLPAKELHRQLKIAKLIPILDDPDSGILSQFLEDIDRDQTRKACLTVALAAQAYFRDHAEFPESLSDLIPNYLKLPPEDPYAHKAGSLIYRRTGENAVVYSVYENGIDEGAITVTKDEAFNSSVKTIEFGWPDDFGIRIQKPHFPALLAPRPKLHAPKSQ